MTKKQVLIGAGIAVALYLGYKHFTKEEKAEESSEFLGLFKKKKSSPTNALQPSTNGRCRKGDEPVTIFTNNDYCRPKTKSKA